MAPGRKRLAAAASAGVAVALVMLAAPYVATIAFLFDLAGQTHPVRRAIPIRPQTVTVIDHRVPTRHGTLGARLYQPESPDPATIVVFPGIHGGGVDEPRLVRFCRQLASTGYRVMCTPLPALRRFQITSTSTDEVEDVTNWVASSSTLTPRGRVGLVGVSFSGALVVVAAGRPSLAGRLNAVVSVGGYGLLARTLEYLATGALPDGQGRRPHDYGLAVVALDAVDRLVPASQAEDLAHAIRTYLEASLDDSPTREHGMALLADAQRQAAQLPDPARSLMTAIATRDVVEVGRRLAPLIADLSRDPALSPERSPPTTAPVFLIHGQDDNVIPSSETPLLAEYLQRHGNRHVRWLLTPLVSHADLAYPGTRRDAWRLVLFWNEVRATLDR